LSFLRWHINTTVDRGPTAAPIGLELLAVLGYPAATHWSGGDEREQRLPMPKATLSLILISRRVCRVQAHCKAARFVLIVSLGCLVLAEQCVEYRCAFKNK
jgi:hypothetical protein